MKSAMKTLQKGFTLIELMITIAIIGVLAAIALPAYSDYVGRAQLAEALSLMSGARTALTEYRHNEGEFPTQPEQAGLETPSEITGNYVESVTIDSSGSGMITAKMKGSGVSPGVAGNNLLLSPTTHGGAVEWTCKSDGTIHAKYLPKACRPD